MSATNFGAVPAVASESCEPEDRVTRSLLGYGIVAGPLYVVGSLTQALVRDGFEPSRHQWSLLANGDWGWVQIANFIAAGLMTIAFAVGLARALRPGRGGTWGPRLIGGYGAGLVAAGIFRADPALGFPPGTPDEPAAVSWHGMLHFAAAGVGFGCLAAACFVLARRFKDEGRRGWTVSSRVVGAVFLAGFAAVASGGGNVIANVAFTVAVVVVSAWTAALAADRYRRVASTPVH